MNIAEGSIEESKYYLILTTDLGYGETCLLMQTLEEVSRLLSRYAAAILSTNTRTTERRGDVRDSWEGAAAPCALPSDS